MSTATRIEGEGGCLCGAVRYRYAGRPLTFYACHCTDCQTRTGAAFGFSMIIRDKDLSLLQGEPTAGRSESRVQIRGRRFCDACGTSVWTDRRDSFPGILVLRPGTLDDTSMLVPVAHLWTQSAQHWVQIPDGVRRYETQPDDFMELIELWRAERG